ncbi:fluoride efflux transporter FluC [Protaetiibacter mangrovi]|uniref:Fluoride-specific ion channel FluC n=1 Tax=Protaetiibacter mangrovi TaxID=2970926 RepID=A0ABT1ZEQ4_9MICO|nr:CrcB family protein [Protaetiibacter mangrovi]MCS0499184.1 CrcB family protein [Protaetiibacter mangrovi]
MSDTPHDAFPELPLDPDTDVVELPPGPPQPAHLRPALLALVFAGGALGTAAREGLGLVIPADGGVPWAVLAANLAGAFLLGALLEALVRRGPDHGIRRNLRLLVGTGFMGGFTTYSALATDSAALVGAGSGWLALAYAVGTVVVGALATAAGILIAAATHRARGSEGVAG